jgi:hypothetical protein
MGRGGSAWSGRPALGPEMGNEAALVGAPAALPPLRAKPQNGSVWRPCDDTAWRPCKHHVWVGVGRARMCGACVFGS